MCKAVVLAHGAPFACTQRMQGWLRLRGGAAARLPSVLDSAAGGACPGGVCASPLLLYRSGTLARRRGSLCVCLCVCFVFLPLDSAWRLALQRRRAPIYVCFACVWWNVLRVLVMFSSFSEFSCKCLFIIIFILYIVMIFWY